MTSSARRSASTSRLATSAMKRSAALGGIRSVRRTCAGRLAGRERLGDRDRVLQPADDLVEQAGEALALAAQLDERPDRGLLVAGEERVGERPRLALGGGGARLLDLGGGEARRPGRARARASRARGAGAAGARRPGRSGPCGAPWSSSRPSSRARAGDPARQLPRLDAALLGDLAAGLPRPPCAARRRPCCAPPRGRTSAIVSVSPSMPFMAAATCSTSASFQRSTPSAITKRRPMAKVMVVSAASTSSAVHASPSSTSTPAGAALGLRQRAQLGAALGDAAVVVAEDQVGGLEGGHGGRV